MDFHKQGLKETLEVAERAVVLTGSGISQESGIPTFRGNEGYWERFSPQELASKKGYTDHPDIVWEWYLSRRKRVLEAKPNRAHYAIAEMAELFPDFTLITQNVDGLHQMAGSENVLELHGSLFRTRCMSCGDIRDDRTTELIKDWHICKKCGSKYSIRPDVVWFGESLPMDIFRDALEAATEADLFITVGTSALVYPAADLPRVARRNYAYTVEFNLEATPLSRDSDFSVRGKAGESLPLFLSFLAEIREFSIDKTS